jgi:hypothetical protein
VNKVTTLGIDLAKTVFQLHAVDLTGKVGIFKGYRNVSIFFTTNVTTPYSIGYQDLTNGSLVIDLPPGAVAGSINDFWQRAITDLGFAGPDQGKGGKYVCA